MDLYLMRHFKVDHHYPYFTSSAEFDRLRKTYDVNPIAKQVVERLEVDKIYISALVRTKLTALASGYLEEELEITPLLNEVPNRSFMDSRVPLPTFLWKAVGRLQWLLGSKRQEETKKETLARINQLLNRVEREQQDTLLVGHGFLFSQMENVLADRGFEGERVRFFKNGQIAHYKK